MDSLGGSEISVCELRGARILITEDEEAIRRLLARHLEGLGHAIFIAEDGFQAVQIAAREEIDIILSDINMPGLGGIEMVRQIKLLKPEIPIVMISAFQDMQTVREALRAGAYDYISKPFQLMDVADTVGRAFFQVRLVRENQEYQRRLERKVAEQAKALASVYLDTIEALISALDAREQETGNHSERVSNYTRALATQIGLSEEEIDVVAQGALLHDIGKIGITDNILLKPAKLTEEEWKVMRTHPQVGYDILGKVPALQEAAQVVLTHQEKFDGTGYPTGLKGEEIPLGSRIFAIVDTLDAMTTDRPYRKSLPFEAAREEIIRFSGRQFDPKIVEVFLSIAKEEWERLRGYEFVPERRSFPEGPSIIPLVSIPEGQQNLPADTDTVIH